MRNPKRIGLILRLLDEYWQRFSDLRFFQLVDALQVELNSNGEHRRTDFFNFEDDELIEGLLHLMGETRIPESVREILDNYDIRDDNFSFDLAVERCRYSLEIDPNDVKLWKYLGWIYYDRRKYSEAEPCFHKAIELAPEDARAYYYLGRIYCSNRLYTDAWKMFSKAAELEPKDENYREWRDKMLKKLQ